MIGRADRQVLGVVNDPRVETLATDLRSAGFSDFDVQDGDSVSASVGTGLPEWLKPYEDAARKGYPIVTIGVEDEEQAEHACDVLQRNHVLDVRYFDHGTVREISPGAHPSP
jgi:hypothetical protein